MTTKLEQAARQALEALEQNTYYNFDDDIKVLREALAEQAEQEPVAWYSDKGGFNECGEGQPLYTAPVRTKDLTNDEIDEVRNKTWCLNNSLREFAHAVIAADREKNR